jgi:hypothetical protein
MTAEQMITNASAIQHQGLALPAPSGLVEFILSAVAITQSLVIPSWPSRIPTAAGIYKRISLLGAIKVYRYENCSMQAKTKLL